MTSEPEKLLPVIQADREAAADYWLGEGYTILDTAYRTGAMDGKACVQSYARHRLSSPVSGTDMVMVPRALLAPFFEANIRARQQDMERKRSGMPAMSDDASPGWGIKRKHLRAVAEALSASPTPPIPMIAEAGEREAFRPIETWDERDEPVLLLVDYDEGDHALEDARFAITIGHNNDHNVGEGEGQGWLFAGWCWSHDHYVQGKGEVVAWMPLPHILARAWAAFDGEPGTHATTATEDLSKALLAWSPEYDDRVHPLLQAEATRRGASDWTLEDAENVIAFLLSSTLSTPATLDNTAVEGRQALALRNIEAAITQNLRDWEGSTRGDAFSVALSIVQRERATLTAKTEKAE